jgi:hypothetical protein
MSTSNPAEHDAASPVDDAPGPDSAPARRGSVRGVLRWTGIGVLGLIGLCVLWTLVLLATNPGGRSSDAWSRAGDIPEPRGEVATTVVEHDGRGHLVVAGGWRAPVLTTSRSVHRWDPVADEWARLPSLPDARHHAAAAGHEGAVYVSGGGSSVFSWTERTNLWVLRPGAPDWEVLPDLPEGRLGHRMEVVDGQLVLVGGEGPSGRVLVFDLRSGEWATGAPIPAAPRDHLGSVVVEGEVWAIGGRSDGGGVQERVDVYDPGADAWRPGPAMPREVSAAVTAMVDGRVHVVGGEDPGFLTGRVIAAHLVYDPDVGGWQDGPLPIFDVHGAGGGAVDGEVVIAAGSRRQGALTPLALTGATQRYLGDPP